MHIIVGERTRAGDRDKKRGNGCFLAVRDALFGAPGGHFCGVVPLPPLASRSRWSAAAAAAAIGGRGDQTPAGGGREGGDPIASNRGKVPLCVAVGPQSWIGTADPDAGAPLCVEMERGRGAASPATARRQQLELLVLVWSDRSSPSSAAAHLFRSGSTLFFFVIGRRRRRRGPGGLRSLLPSPPSQLRTRVRCPSWPPPPKLHPMKKKVIARNLLFRSWLIF